MLPDGVPAEALVAGEAKPAAKGNHNGRSIDAYAAVGRPRVSVQNGGVHASLPTPPFFAIGGVVLYGTGDGVIDPQEGIGR